MKHLKEVIHVTVTNATSPTAQTFISQLARGDVFGLEQPMILHLMDRREKLDQLRGVALELEGAALQLVLDILPTKRYDEGFQQSNFLILMSPQVDFLEWPDPYGYLIQHAHIFKDHGMALELFGKKTAQVVVVGALALTNAAVIAHFASSFPPERITCVTLLTDVRARSILAAKFHVTVNCVTSVVTWGCAGYAMQYVDTRFARVKLHDDEPPHSVETLLKDDGWLKNQFQKMCDRQQAKPGILSTAQATVDHVRYLALGTPEGQVVGMGVAARGVYGMPPGLYCALPVTVSNHQWRTVPSLTISGCHEHELGLAGTQLAKELEAALRLTTRPRPSLMSSIGSTVLSSSLDDEWDIGSDDSGGMYYGDGESASSIDEMFSPTSISLGSAKRPLDKVSSPMRSESNMSHPSMQRSSIKSIMTEKSSKSVRREDSIKSDQKEGSINSDQKESSISLDQKEGSIKSDQKEGSLKFGRKKGSIKSDQRHGSIKLNQRQNSIKLDQRHDSIKPDQRHGSIKSDQRHGSIKLDQRHDSIKSAQRHGSIKSAQRHGSIKSDQKSLASKDESKQSSPSASIQSVSIAEAFHRYSNA